MQSWILKKYFADSVGKLDILVRQDDAIHVLVVSSQKEKVEGREDERDSGSPMWNGKGERRCGTLVTWSSGSP